jgi:hypothetical protein
MPFLDKGNVVKIWSIHATPPDYKRVVILGESDHLNEKKILAAFINTEPDYKDALSADLSVFHHPLPVASNNGIIEYDSYVNCLHPKEYLREDFVDAITKNSDNFLGTMNAVDFERVVELVKCAETVSRSLLRKYGLVPPRPRITPPPTNP